VAGAREVEAREARHFMNESELCQLLAKQKTINEGELRHLLADVIDDLADQDVRVGRSTASVAALRQVVQEYVEPDSELRHQHDARIVALVEAAKKLRNIQS
jgi:hypothetical protein